MNKMGKAKNPIVNTIKQPPIAVVTIEMGLKATKSEVVYLTSILANFVNISEGALALATPMRSLKSFICSKSCISNLLK